MNNEQARSAVAFAVEQWNAVPTSSFHADVVGNLGLVGLSDITAANVADVIGKDNGGGIHIIFDSDGSIIRDVLGVGYGVLGVATPELVEDGSPAIHESWVIINGEGIPDPASYPGIDVVAEFTGVSTHEFGHATNLAHSQTNGAVVFYGDKPVPQSCDDSAVGYPDVHHVETTYPTAVHAPAAARRGLRAPRHWPTTAAAAEGKPTAAWYATPSSRRPARGRRPRRPRPRGSSRGRSRCRRG